MSTADPCFLRTPRHGVVRMHGAQPSSLMPRGASLPAIRSVPCGSWRHLKPLKKRVCLSADTWEVERQAAAGSDLKRGGRDPSGKSQWIRYSLYKNQLGVSQWLTCVSTRPDAECSPVERDLADALDMLDIDDDGQADDVSNEETPAAGEQWALQAKLFSFHSE